MPRPWSLPNLTASLGENSLRAQVDRLNGLSHLETRLEGQSSLAASASEADGGIDLVELRACIEKPEHLQGDSAASGVKGEVRVAAELHWKIGFR
jgi:hypothetical protein